jgi:hypothetical protein
MAIFFGLLGTFLFLCAVFDVDWFLRMTRDAQHGYPLGRRFTRIYIGGAGLFLLCWAFAEMLSY